MKTCVCFFCGKEFTRKKDYKGKRTFCSTLCFQQSSKSRVVVKCSMCEILFEKLKGRIADTKHGHHFCCRKCKDDAHASGRFEFLIPKKNTTGCGYRRKALSFYGKFCELCDYDECDKILEVHHIDENRRNSDITNLIVLCPNCHRKITLGVVTLKNRTVENTGT